MFVLNWCFLFVTFDSSPVGRNLFGAFFFKDQKLQKNRSSFLRDKGIVIENTTAPPTQLNKDGSFLKESRFTLSPKSGLVKQLDTS